MISDYSTRDQLEKLLKVEEQEFKNIEFEQIKKSMEEELMRRLSYYFYTGQIEKFKPFVSSRYQATKIKVTKNKDRNSGSMPTVGWTWHNESKNSYLEGSNCSPEICLDIKIPWTQAWLTDGAASLINKFSRMDRFGWSALLEASELKIPKVVSEYMKMADELEGLKIGDQLFYGSSLGPSKVNLHRLTVVNISKVREKTFDQFTSLFWLIFCITTCIYLISYFWDHELYSTHRILIMILLVILLPSIILILQSNMLGREQAKQLRHQREIEVVNRKSLDFVKPSYTRVRHLLPFKDGSIYTIQNNNELLMFTASLGRLTGKHYVSANEGKTAEFLTLVLLLFLSTLGYFRVFRDSNQFWNQFSERLEKQVLGIEPSFNILEYNENLAYDNWDLLRSQLETENQVKRRALQQRLVNYESEAIMGTKMISDSKLNSKDVNCVVVCVAPNNFVDINDKSALDYFDDLNKFLKIYRDTCAKYGGSPFMDAHWHQRAMFSFPKSFLSSQRAILFGLDFIKQLEAFDLVSYMPYRVIAKQGSLNIRKVSSNFKHETFIKGAVLQECDAAMELLESSSGLWIEKDLITDTLRSSFKFNPNKLDEWCEVSGVKNVKDHLSLLNFPSCELQRTALELLSFRSDQNVLNKILDKLPTLEPEVEDQAVSILNDYLSIDETRSKIFDQIVKWAEEDCDEIVLKVLMEFNKQSVNLNKSEIDILLKLNKPIHEEVALRLILHNTDYENLEDLEVRIKSLSNFLKSRLVLIKCNEQPSFECLDELYNYLQETDEEFLNHILEMWCALKIDRKSAVSVYFNEWIEDKKEIFLNRLLDLVKSESISIKLKSLRVISNLKLSDTESQLVQIFYDCKDPEIKSEILFTLQNVGSNAYLLQNLN